MRPDINTVNDSKQVALVGVQREKECRHPHTIITSNEKISHVPATSNDLSPNNQISTNFSASYPMPSAAESNELYERMKQGYDVPAHTILKNSINTSSSLPLSNPEISNATTKTEKSLSRLSNPEISEQNDMRLMFVRMSTNDRWLAQGSDLAKISLSERTNRLISPTVDPNEQILNECGKDSPCECDENQRDEGLMKETLSLAPNIESPASVCDENVMLIEFSDTESGESPIESSSIKSIMLIEFSLQKSRKKRIPKKFYRIMSTVINIANDNRPYALVRIFDIEAKGLLDSGAQASIINALLAEQLEARGIKLRECDIYITTADGARHPVMGYMNIPYTLNGVKHTVATLVIRQACVRLVLGMDFWNAFRIKPCVVEDICALQIHDNDNEIKFDVNDRNENSEVGECTNVTSANDGEIKNDTIYDSFEADVTPPKCISAEEPHILSDEQRNRLNEVINKFPFTDPNGELNKTHLKVVSIDTGDAKPYRCKMRYDPPWKTQKIIEEVDRLEKRGIVKRVESSEWLLPILAVPKSNGTWRVCSDARGLNALTKTNCYPQQNANRILGLIGKAKYITTIDMTDAFFQIPLHPDSQPKTAFAIPTRGTYVFERMAMGLKNSGAELCSLIDSLFGALFEPKVFPYLDDIVVVTETFDEHLEILLKVADRFEYANLTISAEKSRFCYKRLKYLGVILDENGINMDKSRIEAVANFPIPKCTRDIQRVMGMAGWYRRFIKNFSEITAPISELLKKNTKFVWNVERERAFNQIIVALTTAPVLANPDYKLPFEIQADACKQSCGAVLVQYQDGQEKVIAYMSQKFTDTQKKYHVTELECLAVILAIEKFRPYVEGSHFRVITDHHSLLWLKNLKDPNGRLARWALRLQAYDFTLMHRKGKHHVVPDALSRSINVIDVSQFENTNDKWYTNLKKLALDEPQNHDNLKVVNELLYIRNNMNEECENPECLWRLCVPKENRVEVIRSNHDDDTSCHFGRFKTINKIRDRYYWPSMNQSIAEYVRNCEVCKITKAKNQILTPPAGKFVEAIRPWRVVATDICGPFVPSKSGNRFLLVAVDVFSKFAVLKAVRNETAKAVTEFIKNDVVLKFACPEIIVSDNGVQYKSILFKGFIETKGIQMWYTANYFAQGNQTECVNKVIGNALRVFLREDVDHRKWDEKINEIANAINSSIHTTTQKTPYELNFGQKMAQHANDYRTHIDANDQGNRDEAAFQVLREKVQKRINEAREKYTKRYDLRTRTIEYKVGDIVFRENTILSDASKYISKKLAPKRIKCEITQKTGTNTYKLRDCDSGKEAIFHAQKFSK